MVWRWLLASRCCCPDEWSRRDLAVVRCPPDDWLWPGSRTWAVVWGLVFAEQGTTSLSSESFFYGFGRCLSQYYFIPDVKWHACYWPDAPWLNRFCHSPLVGWVVSPCGIGVGFDSTVLGCLYEILVEWGFSYIGLDKSMPRIIAVFLTMFASVFSEGQKTANDYAYRCLTMVFGCCLYKFFWYSVSFTCWRGRLQFWKHWCVISTLQTIRS